ncbi:helix-turn-helix domain-containing protein [Paenibacillus jamilae]|uniref:helix-turn-helix domain-containing protein n=1 Tax=Paenibacillus jamilae TaxID=114136 RepID=UPI0009EEDAFB|nr:helix-turn-helix domain-containing protein [Paenibacillus jamilae]
MENRRFPLHWHFEPEFFIARGGELKVQIGNHFIKLNSGDGIFISSNTLHSFEQINENDICKCPNIVFSAEIIAPYTSSIYQKYVRPLLTNSNLPYFVLHSDIPWHKEILNKLFDVFASPIEYLLKHRIESSKRLLCSTTRSIQEICLECGLNSSSYFIKVFKRNRELHLKSTERIFSLLAELFPIVISRLVLGSFSLLLI